LNSEVRFVLMFATIDYPRNHRQTKLNYLSKKRKYYR